MSIVNYANFMAHNIVYLVWVEGQEPESIFAINAIRLLIYLWKLFLVLNHLIDDNLRKYCLSALYLMLKWSSSALAALGLNSTHDIHGQEQFTIIYSFSYYLSTDSAFILVAIECVGDESTIPFISFSMFLNANSWND